MKSNRKKFYKWVMVSVIFAFIAGTAIFVLTRVYFFLNPGVEYFRVAFTDIGNELGFDDYVVVTAFVSERNRGEVVIREDTDKTTLRYYYYFVEVIDIKSGHPANANDIVVLSSSELRFYDGWRRLRHITFYDNCRLRVGQIVLLKLFKPNPTMCVFYNRFDENTLLYKLLEVVS